MRRIDGPCFSSGKCSVVDPHFENADPDLSFEVNVTAVMLLVGVAVALAVALHIPSFTTLYFKMQPVC